MGRLRKDATGHLVKTPNELAKCPCNCADSTPSTLRVPGGNLVKSLSDPRCSTAPGKPLWDEIIPFDSVAVNDPKRCFWESPFQTHRLADDTNLSQAQVVGSPVCFNWQLSILCSPTNVGVWSGIKVTGKTPFGIYPGAGLDPNGPTALTVI